MLRWVIVAVLSAAALFFGLRAPTLAGVVSDPAVVGEWSAPFPIPAKGIHATMLPTGKVLWFSYPVNEIGSDAWLWDPTTGATKNVSLSSFRDVFCVGQSLLADGRIFASGGHVPGGAYGDGVKDTDFFDPSTETWTPGPKLSIERWYPTNIELPDGRVLIFGGQKDDVTPAETVERYDPASNTLTRLPDTATKRVNSYPRMHLLPSGKISFTNQKRTELFDPATSTWSYVTNMNYGGRGLSDHSVLLPGLNKVLEFGGKGSTAAMATNSAEIIDFSASRPRWRNIAPMNSPRMYGNAVTLPDGTVLMVGGGQGPGIYDNPVHTAELFDPVTETWKVMAAQQAPRIYHSTAVLLPDGRVVSAGQDKGTQQFTAEVYSPPYLFKGARPSITTAPTVVGYNQGFSISTPDASSVTRVALIRPGSVTHSVDFDQRYVDLSFTVADGGTLAVTSPPGATHAPPGHYMLFIVSSSGVPSVASWVKVSATADRPAPTVTGFAPASGPVGTTVTISGSNFTGATNVTFAGTAASFTVDSATQVTAVVPAGASTGRIAVTTPDGTGTSSSDFTVTTLVPSITGFTPASGATGTTVTIDGSNFTGATSVTFAGTEAGYTVDSATQITAVVPAGASTGRIAVTTAHGTATSSADFTVTSASAPTVTGFAPASGPVGTTVTIDGSNFTGATNVTFAGVEAGFMVDSATQITAVVPTGAGTGPIAVTTPDGTATSSSNFTVTALAPSITGFTPASGPVGTTVRIDGSNFTGATNVTFAGTAASFTVDSATQITAVVPAGASTGRIAVTTPDGTATSSADFTVTTYRGTVLSDGPAGYWRLAETTGDAVDETGNAAPGTYANGVIRGVEGALVTEPNAAAHFDGKDDYVSVPDNSTLDVGDVFTYELWVKRGATQGTTQRLLHKGGGAPTLGFGTNNKLVLIPGGSGVTTVATSTTAITDQIWHHVVVTKNGPDVHIYVDRVDVTGPVTNTTMTNSSSALNIGRATSGSGYFHGDLDEVAVYPVALTHAQVLAHFWAR
jgi:Domain of unknown function (DUF1929)/Concanavalin A-like lectin/glucanases superfamily/Glyoxal oxidase N-terminus/IPT/TIG domain/Galactose oxidase, central domain